MLRILLIATTIATTSSAAIAADAVAAEPSASSYSWTGAYVGVQGGYAWGGSDVGYHIGNGETLVSSHDPDGFVGGVYAGYNHQLANSVVLGVDADIAWTKAGSGFRPFNVFTSAAVDFDYSAAVRARIGYASGRWLPYIAGGLAISQAEISYDMAFQDAVVTDTLTGWTLGAGTEYAASDNLVLRVEYRYSDYGNGTAKASAFPSYPNDRATYDLRSSDIRLGIAYKF